VNILSVFFNDHKVKLISSASTLPGPPISTQQLTNFMQSIAGKRNATFAKIVAKRLGISSRHLIRELIPGLVVDNDLSLKLGTKTLKKAYQSANIQQADYLIGHTTSPHTLLPPNIAWLAERLKHTGPYMEFRQACCGFANALQTASSMLASQSNINNIGIVGSEVGSLYFDFSQEFINKEQLVNFMQMGDGAGAVVVAKDDGTSENIISDIYFGHIGLHKAPGFGIKDGGASNVECNTKLPHFFHEVSNIRENGAALFISGIEAIKSRGYCIDDFKYIIPHQVNGHLAKLFSKELNIDANKVVVDADQLGNLGSAAIWVSLDRLRNSGKLSQGDKVLILGAEATKYMYGGFVYQH